MGVLRHGANVFVTSQESLKLGVKAILDSAIEKLHRKMDARSTQYMQGDVIEVYTRIPKNKKPSR